MSRTHPFLHIHYILDSTRTLLNLVRYLGIGVGLLSSLKVASEVLQECDFLLQVLGVLSEGVLAANILSVSTATLHVVEVESIGVQANLRGVIEEDTSCFVAQAVAKTVLRRVVDPFLDPDLVVSLRWEHARCVFIDLALSGSRCSVIWHTLTATHGFIASNGGRLGGASNHSPGLVARCGRQKLTNICR